jgi:Mg-chelatase subunit ChlD
MPVVSTVLPAAVLLSLVLGASGAHAESTRSIALVLDASGSMNAVLPDGVTRIDAARAAVASIVGKLEPRTRLSLRAYGHQSPRARRDCADTAVLVPFGDVAESGGPAIKAAGSIKAQGYTPITYVLRLAAEDLTTEESGARTVILVSDGKETCAGDPCAAARALAEADAKLVVHTVGLAVDAAARFQLHCIASVARGIYVDAGDTSELDSALARAVEEEARNVTELVIEGADGKIRIEGAPPATHAVIDAATGEEVAAINTGYPGEVAVPPGIYNVRFENGPWMGVEVHAGETTVLRPGFLKVEGRDLWGNKLLDPETLEAIGQTRAGYDRVALVPTTVLVTFANVETTIWPEPVEIREGETTLLRPAGLKVTRSKPFQFRVIGPDGAVVAEVSSAVSRIALPPGAYRLDADGAVVELELHEGEDVEVPMP